MPSYSRYSKGFLASIVRSHNHLPLPSKVLEDGWQHFSFYICYPSCISKQPRYMTSRFCGSFVRVKTYGREKCMRGEGDRRKYCIGLPVIKHNAVPYLSKRISFFLLFFQFNTECFCMVTSWNGVKIPIARFLVVLHCFFLSTICRER